MTQILELAHKDLKMATVTILNEVKEKMLVMNEKIGNLSKETNDFFKNLSG